MPPVVRKAWINHKGLTVDTHSLNERSRSVDWIIVGAGLTAATLAERITSVLGQTVHLVEKRGHVAGNAHDAINEAGILVHRYGPHIFHTNSAKVQSYVERFAEWRPYEHHVRAILDGREVTLPFNLNSLDQCFSRDQADIYRTRLVAEYGADARVPILKLRENADRELRNLGDFIYAKVFEGYTIKQWNLRPEQLSPGVTARVPVLVSRDDRYFQDSFQAMPVGGFTRMVERMLDHPKIRVDLNTDFHALEKPTASTRIIYTGPIDAFFGRQFGALPYRSLRFEFETLNQPRFQSVGTMNYPNDHEFTRITEQKIITGEEVRKTTLVREFPEAHDPALNEPYYPIPCDWTQDLYRRYEALARERPDVLFAGRLGEYRYYNMDQAIGSALATFEKVILPQALQAEAGSLIENRS